MPSKPQPQPYSSIFFTWCVPGLLLIIFGTVAGEKAMTHFGVSLIGLGLIYYGRVKRHPYLWYMFWLSISTVYIILGMTELIRR